MNTDIKQGTVTGTGAALNVQLGFQPKIIRIINETSGDELFWTFSMGADKGYKRVAAGTGAFISSGGITVYPGTSADENEGFTLGTDSDINVNAEVLHYMALR